MTFNRSFKIPHRVLTTLLCLFTHLSSNSKVYAQECSTFLFDRPTSLASADHEKLIFNSQNFQIRPITSYDDFLKVYELFLSAGENVTLEWLKGLFYYSQRTLTEAKKAFLNSDQEIAIFNLGVYEGNTFVGTVTFKEYVSDWQNLIQSHATELGVKLEGTKWLSMGIALLPKYQGRGIGQEITRKRVEIAFELLDADVILIDIQPTNLISIKNVKRFGFRPLGFFLPISAYETEVYYLNREDFNS